jgi:hypothetical protein
LVDCGDEGFSICDDTDPLGGLGFCWDCGIFFPPPPPKQSPPGNPPPGQPSQPPPPPSSVNYGNETLGIPSNLQHPWGIWSALIPTGNCGDISCPPIGFGFDGSVLPGLPNIFLCFSQASDAAAQAKAVFAAGAGQRAGKALVSSAIKAVDRA